MKKLLQSLFVAMLFAFSAMAQQRTITGTVTGQQDGKPLPGVTVKISGTKQGTQTNASGKYSISVESSATSLEFSYLGFISQTKLISSDVINIALVEDSKILSEIVVTSNSIKRDKRTIGYSAPTINSEELVQGGSPSPISSLAGKVAGVNISSSSATPGSSSRVVLRGGSSITGSNQALIVVDGVPIDNSSTIGGASVLSSVDFGNRGNDLAPNDIASVTVLKGPAAAALYGARASNGALIITTKAGSKGEKTSITFNTGNTFSSILKLPDFQNEYGQGYYDQVAADGKSATYTHDLKENTSWGAPFTGEVIGWGQEIDGVRLTKPYSAVKNNVRDFFTTGFATDNSLSFSGGGEKSTFYMALNALNSDGIWPGSKSDSYNKYGVRFNGTSELSSKFTAGVNFNYNRIDASDIGNGQGGAAVYNNVLQTPRDIPLNTLGDLTNKYNAYGYVDGNGVKQPNKFGYYNGYTMNPYFIIENYGNYNDVSRVTGNFNLAYKPYAWLDFKERVGIDTYSDRRRRTVPKYSYSVTDKTPEYAGTSAKTSNGLYEIDQINITELVHDFMVTATHKFNSDFEGSLMVGNNIRQRQTNRLTSGTNASGGLVVPGWYNLSNSNGPVNISLDEMTKRRLFGLYADLNLSYKTFLFLEATARNDWSSTLPAQNNSFFYPSVSGSFVFSELLKESSVGQWLNYGKLRASWAQVGNDTDPYQLLSIYNKALVNANFGSTVFPFGNVAGLSAGTTIGNINLKPERTTAFEVGTELGLFNNRFSVDFSYYKSNSKDQILAIPIANSTGYGFSLVNAGEIQNKGVELTLRGTAVKTEDFNLDFFATYTKNENLVVSLLPGVDQISIGGGFSGLSIVAAKGRPYGEFYGVNLAKDNQGRVIVDKETGIPVNGAKAEYLGSYNPKYQGSFGTNVRFKQLSLAVLFDTKQGGKMYSKTKNTTGFAGIAEVTGGDRFGSIWPNSVYLDDAGNSVVNTTVGYIKQDFYTGSVPAGFDVIDASYVKLRSASLAYTFSKAQLKKLPFGSLAIGLFGNNLFLWASKENKYVDPEINATGAGNAQGFDFGALPSVRNYGFNVKVSF
ncbi:SusC/RagA family TonB-linked outer membrane protein [Pedobacter sp. B4-66]|uniref:SusC/RagA family TonB-linked outer membrane protein n=1 Tax=Pedobacter sp. B4-66 TaxID=2817280 RepID=UPI001BDAA9CA|nr:SusC/RagA family TonB-linked outer membrane protein [Pedobacter sp. B4-66]